ncbi:MAG: glycosyltransferase family 2 protein [Gammaproteobacteria bacterium]|nr:glycosyltransferase family 2 protein [Pseudomonadales bacterium]MCP5348322.1 glycosyltransferase family 2 protein [Pseudomonadales bacterium]
MNQPLSVFIICQDEERIIDSCLRQAAKLADEIVIVDSGSSDRTLEIARRYTDRIFHQDWLGYGRQKNSALSRCSNEWVLSLDADEVLSDALIGEIRKLDLRAPAYRIARKLFIGDRFIRWGGYYPDYQLRLFRKSLGRFSNAMVHESVKLSCHDQCPQLKHPLEHFSYRDLMEMKTAFREFARLSDRKRNFPRAVMNFAYTFLNKFLLRFGFLHGLMGLRLALNHAEYSYLKYRQNPPGYLATPFQTGINDHEVAHHPASLGEHSLPNR